jgi:hypothetical protein
MVSEWSFRVPFIIQIGPALVFAIGVSFLPYSPRWLVAQSRKDEALVNLARIRSLPTTDHRVRAELLEICVDGTV